MPEIESDRSLLRNLARDLAEIAALDVHQQTIANWKRLNMLQPGKPMVYIYQEPWHELDVDGELTLLCQDDFNRSIEQQLRRTLYHWRHLRGDMVILPQFINPYVIRDSGYGLDEDVDIVRTDDSNDVVSRHYHVRIRSEADLDLIKTPVVSHDIVATRRNADRLNDLFGDILPIVTCGVGYQSYAPWDWLVRLWGVQEALVDLVERPALVHAAMERLTNAVMTQLDQLESQNLLTLSNTNITGQGGLGYTDVLPQPGFDPAYIHPRDMWGGAMSQIFSAVSPAIHEEFALQYEARWLKRFGLCYYGCCDPLDWKVPMLKRNLPNLRKISMSPWVDVERGARAIGADYVFSYKPSPAVLAGDEWHPEQVRADLTRVLEITRGCYVELILKDISTVRYQPQRLWEWAEIARQVAEEFAI
jgi:hypothetical protein